VNLDQVREIIALGGELVEATASGSLPKEAAGAVVLLKIIRKAIEAYQEHTGQPLDPSLIKVEAPL
jgi:hypothetical protein